MDMLEAMIIVDMEDKNKKDYRDKQKIGAEKMATSLP